MKTQVDFTDNGKSLATQVRSLMADASGVLPAMDRITRRADLVLEHHLMEVAAQMGAAPAPFALVLFGSEGRGEQTFKTDQDNAIIVGEAGTSGESSVAAGVSMAKSTLRVSGDADNTLQQSANEGGESGATFSSVAQADWFLEFGKRLNDRLDQSGYAYCKGGIMAGNPKWCVPLGTWKKYFRSWVLNPEPMAVMQSSIFFDMRYTYGDPGLSAELRSYLDTLLADRSDIFFYHMVQNALKVQVPPATLRKFWLWFQGRIDLKYMLMPVVGLARIMALRHKIYAIGTVERIRLLSEAGLLEKGRAATLLRSFELLNFLRLARQLDDLDRGAEPGNMMVYKELSAGQLEILEEALDGVLLARTMLRNAIGSYF
jgi:CBS domain-containing protein